MDGTGGRGNTGGVESIGLASLDAFFAALALAPIGVAQLAPDGRFLRANHHLCALLGYDRHELLGRTLQGITHPDDLPDCMALNARVAIREISGYRRATRLLRPEGSAVRCRLAVSAMPPHGVCGPAYLAAVVRRVWTRVMG